MADRFYGVSRGAQMPTDVSESSSTTGSAVELRINDTIYDDKMAVLMALRAITAYMELTETTPIA